MSCNTSRRRAPLPPRRRRAGAGESRSLPHRCARRQRAGRKSRQARPFATAIEKDDASRETGLHPLVQIRAPDARDPRVLEMLEEDAVDDDHAVVAARRLGLRLSTRFGKTQLAAGLLFARGAPRAGARRRRRECRPRTQGKKSASRTGPAPASTALRSRCQPSSAPRCA